jgi:pimeloyl-ACP methyl ester carboxylesterase
MPTFNSDGVNIHFEDQGSGAPVILVHGFASRAEHNWGLTGWYKTLTPRYRVIALDCRGHGQSDKPHDVKAYSGRMMEDDVIRLMDHLGLRRALLMGYSMGGHIGMGLLAHHPDRFRAVVLGGIGFGGGVSRPEERKRIVAALLAESASTITEPRARQFRQFAEANKNDLKALAACMGSDRPPIALADLTHNTVPVLVVAGTKDDVIGRPEDLAIGIPHAQLLKLEGRDHLNAPGDKNYHQGVLRFFANAPA